MEGRVVQVEVPGKAAAKVADAVMKASKPLGTGFRVFKRAWEGSWEQNVFFLNNSSQEVGEKIFPFRF